VICATCVALEAASDDQLRRLVVWQARQIDRLTGGEYEEPDFDEGEDEEPAPVQAPDALTVVEGLLNHEDIFRRPGRVAAPRLVERLALAGITLTREEPGPCTT
jgi:hypothetical protein